MKVHIRLLSLILLLVIVFTAFTSCVDNTANKTTKEQEQDTKKATDNSDKSETSAKADPDSIIIFKDGTYTAKVIMPDRATAAEKSVYNLICAAIKEKTDEAVPQNTDFLPAGQTRDTSEYAILVGNTNYSESKQVFASTDYGNATIKAINNKLVLAFMSKDEGVDLITAFKNAIKIDSEKCVWISKDFSSSIQGKPQLEGLPKYTSASTEVVNCGGDTSMIVATNTTLSEFNNYCSALEKAGFALYSSRDDVNKNCFRTYTKDSVAITAYFTPSSTSARIIAGPIDDIPTKEKDNTPETVSPSLTLLSQGTYRNNGLGMVYLLPNGKFLIFDGGYSTNGALYDVLEDLAPNKKSIVIAAWYISHPHGDHQQALISLLKERHNNITIESVLYNYTTADQYNAVTTGADGAGSARSFETTVSQYLGKKAKIIKPHSGQIYEYGSSKVEILYTVEDILPKKLDYLNTSSLVVRITVGGHSTLALADTTHVSGNILRTMYGSYLQTDAVQLAHHGTFPGYANLYTTIKAKLLIWPSNFQNVKAQINDSAVAAAVNQATDIYVCNTQNITLNLPYIYINNKQQFQNSLERS